MMILYQPNKSILFKIKSAIRTPDIGVIKSLSTLPTNTVIPTPVTTYA